MYYLRQAGYSGAEMRSRQSHGIERALYLYRRCLSLEQKILEPNHLQQGCERQAVAGAGMAFLARGEQKTAEKRQGGIGII